MNDKLETLISALQDCAVTGTPGSSTWKRAKVRQLVGEIVQAVLPPGIQAWKLDMIADYVTLLDKMEVDLGTETVTFHKEPRRATDMQDDLHRWAEHMRDPFIRVWAPQYDGKEEQDNAREDH